MYCILRILEFKEYRIWIKTPGQTHTPYSVYQLFVKKNCPD